jgi:molybdopterin-containing oxidoreductase family iron-sulfur binding subunit
LEDWSHTEEFRRVVEREFPSQTEVAFDPLSRRTFLTLMGASLALGGIGGCSVKPAPTKEIVPYVRAPEEVIPGKPLYYASAMTLDGGAVGLLIETHLGRPTKVEGNPNHPASLGATSAQHQASVLELYDPDRSQTVRQLGRSRTWADAAAAIRALVEQQRPRRGAGLRLLTETVVSPTLREQLETLRGQLPDAKWHVWEPLNQDAAYHGARLAFGETVIPRYDFSQADVILSLDDDFLGSGPEFLRLASDYIERRRGGNGGAEASHATMNRLYVVETTPSCTGAKADHRLSLRGADIVRLARAMAKAVGLDVQAVSAGEHSAWVSAVARDLESRRGRSLVLAGNRQPAAVHLLAHAINDHLGNVGKTVDYFEPVEARPVDRLASLGDLTDSLGRGEVECLVILGGDPVLTAPADIPFVEHLEKAPLRIHIGLYEDETARLCHWHLPEAHFMEAWSDTRAYDGTASIVQPVVEPLHGGRSAHEVLALFTEQRERPGREIVSETWRKRWKQESAPGEFETRWQTALHDGVIPNTSNPPRKVSLSGDWQTRLESERAGGMTTSGSGSGAIELELVLVPDPSIHDGRFANNGWLQELPKPLTKLTWGNAAMMSPRTAKRLGLDLGSYAHGGEHGGYHMPVVELEIDGRKATAPLWILPGQADDTVGLYLGYGREYAGRVGGMPQQTIGCNAYPLRSSKRPWFAAGLRVSSVDRTEIVACTQEHHSMQGREPVRSVSQAEFQRNPDAVQQAVSASSPAEESRKARVKLEHGSEQASAVNEKHAAEQPLNLYEPFDYSPPKHKWGMSIDLTSCIGCNACVVACQSENNIPVVGKDQVSRGREMHWIRVDRYLEGEPDRPGAFHFQPLPCMHCENAPCEYVCPVAATVHSSEGLNEMIYNRCVGTRFCSNNCPYKVRRFNFLFYADFQSPERRMQYNPDVTVRSRGVMEKCTYCVQRIREAEIGEDSTGRALVDGDVLTACQAACPTRAIVFGDMNDPRSKVKQSKDSKLHYSLLDELNTVPRTTYLAELRNPNPELAEET